jgi:manganese oxidase
LDSTPQRRVRLAVNEKAALYGNEPGFSYVASTSTDPARDSMEIPARPLVLVRGERAEITVVNRLSIATAVHWHGIELESYYDGVGGWSGDSVRRAPVIAPGDSFVVRFTPPRAGTFIFHAHADDMRQMALGLYGALIVLPPGEAWNPARDHLVLVSQMGRGPTAVAGVNGSATPPPMALAAGVAHRLRFINISVADDADFELRPLPSVTTAADTSLVRWRAIAKDGADLHASRATRVPARLFITPGETYDFEIVLPPGDYMLRMRSFQDASIMLRVR